MELMIQPQIAESRQPASKEADKLHTFCEGIGNPLQVGTLRLASRFFLAPLAGYTTLGFRLAVRELGGVGLATTDLINARALLLNSRKTQELLRTCPADRPLAVQIYGTEPTVLRDAAQWLQDYGVTAVDP